MCAILGISSKNTVDMDLFRSMLNQSMIRGKHATGIAWIEDDKIKHLVIPVSANNFKLPNIVTQSIIGHCRYSTSDLDYNQPIVDSGLAVAHNGVITQTDPNTWEETYKYKFKTRCDSEIILRNWQNKIHPINTIGSMATLILDTREKNAMHFFRNEQRPLYYSKNNDDFYIASTKNILERTGITQYKKTDACTDYKIINNVLTVRKIRDVVEDLQ